MSDGVQFGYSLGGNNNGNPLVTADCTTFSTQATAALTSANLSQARDYLAAMSDGVRFGYSLGGDSSATADCTTFSTQATAALASANLSLARYGLAAMSDYNV
jgi:phosphoenolpyruvate carboxylase